MLDFSSRAGWSGTYWRTTDGETGVRSGCKRDKVMSKSPKEVGGWNVYDQKEEEMTQLILGKKF